MSLSSCPQTLKKKNEADAAHVSTVVPNRHRTVITENNRTKSSPKTQPGATGPRSGHVASRTPIFLVVPLQSCIAGEPTAALSKPRPICYVCFHSTCSCTMTSKLHLSDLIRNKLSGSTLLRRKTTNVAKHGGN